MYARRMPHAYGDGGHAPGPVILPPLRISDALFNLVELVALAGFALFSLLLAVATLPLLTLKHPVTKFAVLLCFAALVTSLAPFIAPLVWESVVVGSGLATGGCSGVLAPYLGAGCK